MSTLTIGELTTPANGDRQYNQTVPRLQTPIVPTGQPAAPTQAPGPATEPAAPTEAAKPPSGGETTLASL